MIEIDLFKRLLEKYKFIEVIIPEEIQKYIVRSRKRVLKASLKAVNDLGFFYSFTISVYFLARRIGFSPSVFMSKIIVLLLTLLSISLIAAGGLLASIKIINFGSKEDTVGHWTIEDRHEQTEHVEEKDETHTETSVEEEPDTEKPDEPVVIEKKKDMKEETDIKKTVKRKKETSLNIKARLGVSTLIPRGVDKNEAAEISSKLFTNLQKLMGKEKVIYLAKNRKQKNVNRQLIGRLSKLGSSRVLAVRVVNSNTGDVLYDKTITYKKDDPVENNISEMAQEINNIASIWK